MKGSKDRPGAPSKPRPPRIEGGDKVPQDGENVHGSLFERQVAGEFRRSKLYVKYDLKMWDYNAGEERQVTFPESQMYYFWCHPEEFAKHIPPYRFVMYGGGGIDRGLPEGGFDGTGLFHKDEHGRVQQQDVFLLFMPRQQYVARAEARRREREWRQQQLKERPRDVAYRAGVRTFGVDRESGEPTEWN